VTSTVPHLIVRAAPSAAERNDDVTSTSEAVIELLRAVGVRSIYGIVGGGIAPFADAVGRSELSAYSMRHEGGAAFAACEASLAAGRPTAVITTTGPGLTNALTGILAARSDGAHVIVVSGSTAPRQRGRLAVQETSDQGLVSAASLASAFDLTATIDSPDQLPDVAEWLARGLENPHGFVAHLSLSLAVQRAPFHGRILVRRTSSSPRLSDEAIHAAACALREPFAIWAGFGARRAAAELRTFAEKTGAGVMLTPRGKGVFPESHPLFLGVTGIGGHDVGERLQRLGIKRTLVLGTRMGEFSSTWDPKLAPLKGFIHVDVNPEAFHASYPNVPTLPVNVDVRRFLLALTPHVSAPTQSAHTSPLVVGAGQETSELVVRAPNGPVRPQMLMQAIQQVVVDNSDAILFAEPGNSFAWTTHLLRFTRPRYRLSGWWASMGHMVTGAVGAALETSRSCVVVTGDGSMLMQSEVSTAAKYRAPVMWIVLNDARYGMTEDGMHELGLSPPDMHFPRVDFVAWARAVGADGIAVKSERELLPAIAKGLAARTPFVVDVDIDVNERAPFLSRVKSLAAMGAGVVKGVKAAT
jgi:acetolactate synthase-1/2/3 large subunit